MKDIRKWRLRPAVFAAVALSMLSVLILRPAAARTVTFSGSTWTVRNGFGGPGPNLFSDDPENVWVDAQGRLHLAITYRGGIWYCAEVISTQTVGYGGYGWVLDSRVDNLDLNAVLGLFTYGSDANEVDIEFSRFGGATATNAQYVVQPAGYDQLWRWNMIDAVPSAHGFVWSPYSPSQPENVEFASFSSSAVLQDHRLTEPLPPLAGQQAHMNLWLYGGMPPSGPQEVIISSFGYRPL